MDFHTSGLLSKHGFNDGDLIWDLLLDHGIDMPLSAVDEGSPDLEHDLLALLVTEHVIPKLDQTVVAYRVSETMHNPIRAESIDGRPAGPDSVLTPAVVAVDDQLIVDLARSMLPKIVPVEPAVENLLPKEAVQAIVDQVVAERRFVRPPAGKIRGHRATIAVFDEAVDLL